MAETKAQTQAARIFLRAAEYIRNYGWQKEGMGEHGQPRCSVGALASSHKYQRWDKSLASSMYGSLCEELNGMSLTQYNTKFNNGEMVACLYERVAEKLRHQISSRKISADA